MSQVFGYICSNDSLTSEVMNQVGEPLRAIEPEDRVGLGIGWLQEGRSLLRKHPKRKAASVDVPSLVADLPTRSLVGHVRHKELGRVGTKQLQPFRFRNWVYAQRGANEGFEAVYETLRASVPDHVGRNIGGTTLAELVFHVFYTKVESQLSTTPKAQWPHLYAQKMSETMAQLEKLSHDCGNDGIGSLQTLAVTDRCIVASCIEEPLHYRLIEGIEKQKEAPLFAGHKPKKIKHERFRALLVANRVTDDDWTRIPDRHVMWVDKKWGVHLEEMSLD